MEEITHQSSNSSNNYDDCKTQATTDETNCLSEKSVTCFEDISNELIYEIFEFLDYFHVYEAFLNLNQRFDNLVTNSNLPIKINFSSISKSSFKHYNKDIIETNLHRISSLCFSDVFIYDLVLTSNYKLSEFYRIETLILNNIESYHLENFLDQLSSLSLLSSLVITSVNSVKNINNIYRQIFRLPTLKYCKLSLEGCTDDEPLPVSTNEYSSIEHLIITNRMYLDEIDSLLSYVPQLRRLSFHSLSDSWRKPTQICSFSLNHLTHISLSVKFVKFDKFKQLIIDRFSMVQVLHITAQGYIDDPAYIDASKWKQLIISHIPNLRIFDIQLHVSARSNYDRLRIETQLNQFTTPFWIERQWFFAHHFYRTSNRNHAVFYSTNPYRRKYYTLYEQLGENIDSRHYESNLDTVQYVHIQSKNDIVNATNYFSNATALIFQDDFSTTRALAATILSRIIPLKQLTKLVIKCHPSSFKRMIELLYFTPNIQTLTFDSIPFDTYDCTLIEQSEIFRLVSTTNNITNVTYTDECTLGRVKLLVALCPRMQYLTINAIVSDLESITQFVLNKTNQNTSHLFSLCFSRASNDCLTKLETLIKSEALLDDYTLKLVGLKLYLWW